MGGGGKENRRKEELKREKKGVSKRNDAAESAGAAPLGQKQRSSYGVYCSYILCSEAYCSIL